MLEVPTNGAAFNPILPQYIFDKDILLAGNSMMVINMTVQPQNKSSNASAIVSIKSGDKTLFTSNQHFFTYNQSNLQNTFRFIYHTPPHTPKRDYQVEFQVQFDNNAASMYRMTIDVKKTRTLERMAIDQCIIRADESSAGSISIGKLELISAAGGINILNDARELIVDEIEAGESWGNWGDLTAEKSIELLFFPTRIKQLTINQQPRIRDGGKSLSPITVELRLEDRLLFASNLGPFDLQNPNIDYHFADSDSAGARGDSLPPTNEIELGGWTIATPGKIWFALTILSTMMLFNFANFHPDLMPLQFLALVPIVIYYGFDLGNADRVRVVIPLPGEVKYIGIGYDKALAADMKWQLLVGASVCILIFTCLVLVRWARA